MQWVEWGESVKQGKHAVERMLDAGLGRAWEQWRYVTTEVARERAVVGEVVRRLGMVQGSHGMKQWRWWYDVGRQEAEDVARGAAYYDDHGKAVWAKAWRGWAGTMRKVGRVVARLSAVWQARGLDKWRSDAAWGRCRVLPAWWGMVAG